MVCGPGKNMEFVTNTCPGKKHGMLRASSQDISVLEGKLLQINTFIRSRGKLGLLLWKFGFSLANTDITKIPHLFPPGSCLGLSFLFCMLHTLLKYFKWGFSSHLLLLQKVAILCWKHKLHNFVLRTLIGLVQSIPNWTQLIYLINDYRIKRKYATYVSGPITIIGITW